MRIFFVLALFLVSCTSTNIGKQSAPDAFQETNVAGITDLLETVISVRDGHAVSEKYQRIMGWDIAANGGADHSMAAFLGAPAGTSIKETVLETKGVNKGRLRIIEFQGIEKQERIRPSGRIWEPGGIFDFNFWVNDHETLVRKLRSEGWHTYTEPGHYSLTTYSGVYVSGVEVIGIGEHDIVAAISARLEPPLENWPAFEKASHVYTVTLSSNDYEASRAFYEDGLGWKKLSYGERSYNSKNLFGIPADLAPQVSRELSTFDRQQTNHPAIKVMAFKGAGGRNFKDRAVAPNLGILAIRFGVESIDNYAQTIKARGIPLTADITQMHVAPYGLVKMFAVTDPDGARIEFLEQID